MNRSAEHPQTALLVIDLQHAMFESDRIPPMHDGARLLATVRELLTGARQAGMPILYVRHDGGAGHVLEAGKKGWQIHAAIAPAPGEPVIDKRTPDSFHETDLLPALDAARIGRLIVAGAQSEVCVDTSCRRAFSLGFETILVSDAHSTWDSEGLTAEQIICHHNRILARPFATLLPAAAIDFTQYSLPLPLAGEGSYGASGRGGEVS